MLILHLTDWVKYHLHLSHNNVLTSPHIQHSLSTIFLFFIQFHPDFQTLSLSSPTVLNVSVTPCPVAFCWPAGHVTQYAVVEEDVLLAICVGLECGDAGGVVVDHHDAGAVETLGLVNKQVAALVVHVVSNDKALWREEEWFEVNYC